MRRVLSLCVVPFAAFFIMTASARSGNVESGSDKAHTSTKMAVADGPYLAAGKQLKLEVVVGSFKVKGLVDQNASFSNFEELGQYLLRKYQVADYLQLAGHLAKAFGLSAGDGSTDGGPLECRYYDGNDILACILGWINSGCCCICEECCLPEPEEEAMTTWRTPRHDVIFSFRN